MSTEQTNAGEVKETRETWDITAYELCKSSGSGGDKLYQKELSEAIKRACLAHAEAVTKNLNESLDQAHEACTGATRTKIKAEHRVEVLTEQVKELTQERDGVKNFKHAWDFMQEAIQERDSAMEKVNGLTEERDGLAKANSDASREMSDTLIRLTQAKELVKDYEFIRSEAVRMEKERDSALARVMELEGSLKYTESSRQRWKGCANKLRSVIDPLQSELSTLRANSVPREVVINAINLLESPYYRIADAIIPNARRTQTFQ